jgi:carbamoyltransferase
MAGSLPLTPLRNVAAERTGGSSRRRSEPAVTRRKAMKILSFFLGSHDSNAVLFDGESGELHYVKAERRTGVKHFRADFGFLDSVCAERSFQPQVVCFSDGDRNFLGSASLTEPVMALRQAPTALFTQARWYYVDHHLAHILSAWPICRSRQADVGIAIDGRGDDNRRVSVYRSPASLQPPVFTSREHRYAHLFDVLGQKLALRGHMADHAGKIMGLQSYGSADPAFIAAILADDFDKDVFKAVRDAERDRGIGFFDVNSQDFRDWLASVHGACETALLGLFGRYARPQETIIFSGGCALSSVFNARLQRSFPGLHIPPHADDGGLSLGVFEAGRLTLGLPEVHLPAFPFIQSDPDFGFATPVTIEAVADLLAAGKVVGWLQGHGEAGARALGHRSLLMNPALPDGKDRINAVKRREPWRPFAPSLLPAFKQAYLCESYDMSYMLHASGVTERGLRDLTAAVHVDGSARAQIVDAAQQPLLASFAGLIQGFERRTGIGALLNTSYNAGGRPIVASRAEALEFFSASAIDALVLGDELLEKTGRQRQCG